MANPRRVTTRPSERKKLVNLKHQIKRLYEYQNEKLDVDIETLYKNPPEKPSFPIVMLGLAFLKDFLDVLDLSLVGILVTTPMSMLMSLILFIWSSSRLSGGVWQQKMLSRYIAVMLIELIPIIKIVPTTIFFVMIVHNQQNKLVQLANKSLDMIQHVGIKFK